jgi:hypothetical protein
VTRSLSPPKLPGMATMLWFVGIGAYVFFLVLVLAFLRGAAARECPKPQPAIVSLEPLPEMQPETIASTMAFEPRHQRVWETDISYSLTP